MESTLGDYMNFFNHKNRRIITVGIAVVMILSMVLPLIVSAIM